MKNVLVCFFNLKSISLVTIEGALFPLADALAELGVRAGELDAVDAFFPPSRDELA